MENKDTLYARWFSGELTEEELNALQADGAAQDLERIDKVTKQWSLPAYDAAAGYQAYKSKYGKRQAKEKKLNWRWAASIAASLLLLVVVYNVVSHRPTVVTADNAGNQQLTLEFGSTVLVNDGSSVSYDEKNWSENRTIDLTGEAYFKVEKGAAFTVNTQNGSIRVLGTEFNVRAWGDNLYVECYEGRVQVNTTNAETVLTQNESVNVVVGQMADKQTINHTSPQWSSGISRFYEESINEVFAEIERQYNININAPQLDKKFSGAFLHQNLETALFDICKPLGLDFSISENKKDVLIE